MRRPHARRHLNRAGFAPKIFTYVDKSGRPLFSVLVLLAFGGAAGSPYSRLIRAAVAYVNVSSSGGEVFDWLLALSGLSTLITWCVARTPPL